MSGYAPGPWIVRESLGDWSVWDANGDPVAVAETVYPETTIPLNEDNARLISAAPDLLEALEMLLVHKPAFRSMPLGAPNSYARQEQDDHIAAEDKANAALAKAKGESQ